MHYFQFNIGDYASHTRHLTVIEDLAYRRLLDLYYLQERPLNSGLTSVARQINMREYETEVQAVLDEFFEFTDEGWSNVRADKEIAHYRAKVEQASRAGKASAERRSNARSTDVQPTNNHKPITNKRINTTPQRPDDVSETVWKDWLQHRKSLRASVTETVIKKIRGEAQKAGVSFESALELMCARGWRGFDAGWVKPNEAKPSADWWMNDRRIK